MSSLPQALKVLDALLVKVPEVTYITPETNYKWDNTPFLYLCEKHADERVKEEMRIRHFFWNQQKDCYHIDKALFFAINTIMTFVNERTEAFHGTSQAFNVGKKLLQNAFHNKMKKLGWKKDENANCWNWVGIENTSSDEETTIPDDVSADVYAVSMPSGSSTQTLNLVRPSPTSGGSGAWSGVVQGYSDNPEIKMWQDRLQETKKKKEDFLGNRYYNPEREDHIAKLNKLNGKIEKCEKEIQLLNEALLVDDEEDDDEW
jgi:hypothetical protein